MDHGTIAAIATPMGSGGIGIIKISGKDAIHIADAVFQSSEQRLSNSPNSRLSSIAEKPHKISYGHIVDPDTRQVLDEVLISVMPGPGSYTREDVVEINTHSGPVVMRAVLDLVIRHGARMAEPGEFTKRAFLNGRIDLTQAEAVMDVINAKTNKALEFAANQVKGDLGRKIEGVVRVLRKVLVSIEACIDFPEDVGEDLDADAQLEQILNGALNPVERLLKDYETAHLLKEGIKVVIAGKPNVGKSSLMNCLLKRDRVIVSEMPGTTRDFIEEACIIENIPVVYMDTAGLHDSKDVVENLGIQKTYEHLEQADIVLFVLDSSQRLDNVDREIYERIKEKDVIVVKNKMDLKDALGDEQDWGETRKIRTSALLNQGMEALEKAIAETVFGDSFQGNPENRVALNLRQKLLLEKSLDRIRKAIMGINEEIGPELIAIDLKEAVQELEGILGIQVSGDVLDEIFNQFCIGK